MEQSVMNAFFALLRFEIKGTELSESVKNSITAETLTELYKFSKQHDLAHLIGDALDKNGLLAGSPKAKQYFVQERNMAIYRCEQLQYELGCICDTLTEAQIPFIPLKGAVLRPLYPEPWMRTSCDIDVLVEEKNLSKAIGALEKKLSYKCKEIGQHDAQIYAESGVHIELHFSLLESGSKPAVQSILNRVWDEVDKTQMPCSMPEDMMYCYLLSHMAKHIKFGGCGVRTFMDIWILNDTTVFDVKTRTARLQASGLVALAQAVEGLVKAWFEGESFTGTTDALAQYILTGGVYGTFENKVAAQQTRKKGKASYLVSRIFLPYRQMKFKYPKLQKCPILYPFYLVKRCFLLLNKEKRALALKEVEQTINGDEKQDRISKLMQNLDI